MSDRPDLYRLSVVIAASDSAKAVARTLASLGHVEGVEVLVVADPGRMAPPKGLPDGVIWLSAEAGSDVPRLRRLGLDHARGEVVAFTEDSCVFAPGWAVAWCAAFHDPAVLAATGPILPMMGTEPIEWAVFFCEYAPFLPGRSRKGGEISFGVPTRVVEKGFPVGSKIDTPGTLVGFQEFRPWVSSLAMGESSRNCRSSRHPKPQLDPPQIPTNTGGHWAHRFRNPTKVRTFGSNPPCRLAGNNFAVRRRTSGWLDEASLHETEVHRHLSLGPNTLVETSGAIAGHVRRVDMAEALRDRLRFGFGYGRRRASNLAWPARLIGSVIGPAILFAQVGRLVLIVLRRGQFLGEFVDGLPLTLTLLTAWSVGEWLGWASAAARPESPSHQQRETTDRTRGQCPAPPRS